LWWCKSKKFGTGGKYPLKVQGANTPANTRILILAKITIENSGDTNHKIK